MFNYSNDPIQYVMVPPRHTVRHEADRIIIEPDRPSFGEFVYAVVFMIIILLLFSAC